MRLTGPPGPRCRIVGAPAAAAHQLGSRFGMNPGVPTAGAEDEPVPAAAAAAALALTTFLTYPPAARRQERASERSWRGQPAASIPSAALRVAMIAPPTVTDTNERTKLVLKNVWRSQPSSRSSAATITIAATIAVW